MLKNEYSKYSLSKIGVDTAENEPEVRKKDQRYSYSLFSVQQDYIFVHSS